MTPQHGSKGTKRKGKNQYVFHRNPRRGPPGILLTCEANREVKCRREGLDILKYYWEHFHPSDQSKQEGKQSLEEELNALKSGAIVEKCPFGYFETGCKGTVWFLFNQNEKEEEESESNSFQEKEESEANEKQPKRQRQETANGPNTQRVVKEDEHQQFDPVEMVTQILCDAKDNKSQQKGFGIPGSRFVTRIIPLQATCSVSIDDIKITTGMVAERFIQAMSEENLKTTRTFAVQIKRRNCGHVKRMDMIEALADQVTKKANELAGKEWSVDLTNPDVTVCLEVCKSICGISLFSRETVKVSPNWNVAEIRDNDQISANVEE